MGNMNRVAVLAASLLVASPLGMAGAPVSIRMPQGGYAPPSFGGYSRIGKGKGRRPRHSSSRFVAQDKRDASKRRNRSR